MKIRQLILLYAVITSTFIFTAAQSKADFIYHTAGKSSFTSSVSTTGLNNLGTENFQSSMQNISENGNLMPFSDPLSQGTANSPYFPNGLSIPVTLQSNTLGDAPVTASPRGANGLMAYYGIGDKIVYNGTKSDSLDIIPETRISAIGWMQRNVAYTPPAQRDVTIRIFGKDDILLDTKTISSMSWDAYVGIEATAGEYISRINIKADGSDVFEGLNELTLYSRANKYINNEASFNAIVSELRCLGTENFEDTTLTGPMAQAFDDALTQGIANGPFDNGLTLPVTIQSSTSADPAVTSPHGQYGLALAETGFAGLASDGLLANYAADGLDIIMLDSDIQAVSFNTIGYAADTDVDVFFYDIAGNLLDWTTVGSDTDGSNFVGFIADDGEYIGRIHLVSQNNLQQGIDNLTIYTDNVPEPATMSLLTLGGLALIRRRKRITA